MLSQLIGVSMGEFLVLPLGALPIPVEEFQVLLPGKPALSGSGTETL